MLRAGDNVIFKYVDTGRWEGGTIRNVFDDPSTPGKRLYYVTSDDLRDVISFREGDKHLRRYWTREEVRKRFPKLLECMRFVAILSSNEAEGGLQAYLNREYHGGEAIAGEAVTHFGGAERVIRQAIRCRTILQVRRKDAVSR